jgi:hypothetical protein
MKRSARITLTAAAIAAGVAIVAILTSMSGAASGPLATSLDRVAAAVNGGESLLRRRIKGSARNLKWLDRSSVSALKNPRRILLGAYDGRLPKSLDGVLSLESTLGVQFPLIQLYSAWGDKPDEQFPLVTLSAIWDIGSVPLVTWEPWLTDFENSRHPGLPLRENRDSHGMAAVARGDYDFYIDAWASDAARFQHPIFVRFAHEMNDPYRYPWGPQNNTKEEYIAAWRRVVTRFRAAGATNVIWVWSPHVAYKYWELYFPGGSTVDWVATGVLNFGPVAQWSDWWRFDEIFGTRYPVLAAFGKPVMIAEFGSLAVGGDRAAWYRDALDSLPVRYPAVKSLLFFETAGDQTVTYQKVDWRVATDTVTAKAVATALKPWAPR